jgi:hypothetical protein
MLRGNVNDGVIWRTIMNNPSKGKDHKKEESVGKGEEKENTPNENKPSGLAERKGQRPAFPFKRKPI